MLCYDSRVALIFRNFISEQKFILQEIEMAAFRVFSACRISYLLLPVLYYYIYVSVTPLGLKIPKERGQVLSTPVPQ